MGRKKAPHYRVVVADSKSPRDGRFVESLGYFKPLSQPARLVLDLERVDHWLGQGADPSHTVKTLINKARKGGDGTILVGEPDLDAERQAKVEALAAKRASEKEAAAAAKAEAEAAAKAEAEAAAAAAAAEAEAEAAQEASAEAEATEEPAAEAEEPAGDEEKAE